MKTKPRAIIILSVLFGYILLQFIWWEILLVKQNGQIIGEKQKLMELSISNPQQLQEEIRTLHHKKTMQTFMIVGEGTVFLLLLLFGIYKIKQAQDKELALNNQQKNFFLSITHELKTPIAATKLQLQTLQKQKLDEVTRLELIGNALLETERLNMLIDNVLLASRLDNGEISFNEEDCDLSALINSIANRYYRNEISKGEIKLNIEEGIHVMLDVHAFPSVITNLVDNAIKYSHGQKEIHLQLKSEKKEAIFRVSDTGIGISGTDKEKIFDRFFRAGNEESRNSKGTGLGLYIVQYIVNRHRAKIKVSNNQPSGSVFEVQLNAV